MKKAKRYYWLKLPEDFFENEAIEWLEEQENGKTYCLFFLKLCLKCINSGGVLVRQVGKILVPYDPSKLATMTKTPTDTVIIAMELLKTIGLIEVYENGEIYIPILRNLVGSETAEAIRKRKQRQNIKTQAKTLENSTCKAIGGTMSGQCPENVPIDNRELLLSYDNNNNSLSENNFNNNLKDNRTCEMPEELRKKWTSTRIVKK